jgi:hypothetical protein
MSAKHLREYARIVLGAVMVMVGIGIFKSPESWDQRVSYFLGGIVIMCALATPLFRCGLRGGMDTPHR